jgi:hypothetical protein
VIAPTVPRGGVEHAVEKGATWRFSKEGAKWRSFFSGANELFEVTVHRERRGTFPEDRLVATQGC